MKILSRILKRYSETNTTQCREKGKKGSIFYSIPAANIICLYHNQKQYVKITRAEMYETVIAEEPLCIVLAGKNIELRILSSVILDIGPL